MARAKKSSKTDRLPKGTISTQAVIQSLNEEQPQTETAATSKPKRKRAAKPSTKKAVAQKPAPPKPSSKKRTSRPKVLVTGISGNLGRLLAKRLHRIAEVHGVDMRPFRGLPKDVVVHHIDIRKKRCEDLFRNHNFQAVYHLGMHHNPRKFGEEHQNFNVMGTTKILDYCQRYQVPKMILLSSANIYGPHPNNPVFLTEDAPLLAGHKFPHIRDLIELDMLGQSFFWKHSEIESVILRPVHVVGPNMRNGITNYLRMDMIPRLLGFDPVLQIIHEEDVVEALVLAMKPGVKGIYNIIGPTGAPLSSIIKTLGKRSISIPHPLVKYLMAKLWDFKLSDFPAPEVDYARFICNVDGSRAKRDMDFSPRYSMKETLMALRGK